MKSEVVSYVLLLHHRTTYRSHGTVRVVSKGTSLETHCTHKVRAIFVDSFTDAGCDSFGFPLVRDGASEKGAPNAMPSADAKTKNASSSVHCGTIKYVKW